MGTPRRADPVAGRRALLPGVGTRVAYDDSAQTIHILGRTPGARDGGAGWTVYAVDPHGDPGSVFSDTPLPEGMLPSAWAMDVESQYPTEDRRELLVFGEDGSSAAVPVSTSAFAWRMPGVIAGVLMSLCLYVLARILFARRSVAVIVGALVLLDGMFFTQSRIGMNDVYVGLFIMAAYTVFAAVWTGWWRGRGAFWIAMPVIGLLLGLALASKWVAAYAVGALVLLLLVRSALGRVLAILGLIGITSVLGYMAIAVAEGQGLGNLPFLAIMVGLTLVAVVVAISHPIAWTDEEVWVAVGAPAVVAVLDLLRRPDRRPARHRHRHRAAGGHPAPGSHRVRARGPWRRRGLPRRRTAGIRPVRRRPGARRPGEPAASSRGCRPRAGCARGRCWACRSCGRPPASPSSLSACTSSATSRGRSSATISCGPGSRPVTVARRSWT